MHLKSKCLYFVALYKSAFMYWKVETFQHLNAFNKLHEITTSIGEAGGTRRRWRKRGRTKRTKELFNLLFQHKESWVTSFFLLWRDCFIGRPNDSATTGGRDVSALTGCNQPCWLEPLAPPTSSFALLMFLKVTWMCPPWPASRWRVFTACSAVWGGNGSNRNRRRGSGTTAATHVNSEQQDQGAALLFFVRTAIQLEDKWPLRDFALGQSAGV